MYLGKGKDKITVRAMNSNSDLPADIEGGATPIFSISIEELPLAVFVTDKAGRIIAANRPVHDLFRYEFSSLVGQEVNTFFGAQRFRWSSENGIASTAADTRRSDGTTLPTRITRSPLPSGFELWTLQDETAQRDADRTNFAVEKQRWRALRDEALERLAGGVAHEFNNFLAVILLQADMIDLQITDTERVVERCEEIRSVAREAAAVAQQLLAFGRRQSMNPHPAVLNSVIEAVRGDVQEILGPLVDLRTDLAADLGVSFVDIDQVVQLVRILAANAADAMPDGGILTIRTENIARGGPLIHKTQSSGSYVQLEFADTGTGMDAKTVEHIFEPFFSTKKAGRASGLGLATVYGIVKQSKGYIWVTSDPNRGTSFRMQFPRIDEPRTVPTDGLQQQQLLGNTKPTVLLVDDDRSILALAANTLRRAGYSVIEADSGKSAIDKMNGHSGTLDLILVDHGIPDMSGSEIVRILVRMYPKAKVVYITGDPGKVDQAAFPGARILPKPFSLKTLLATASDILA